MSCTCGQFLVASESSRKFNKLRLNTLSIPSFLIKKGRSHGVRHGKTEEQKEYHIAWNAWKRCCKKVDSQGDILQAFTIDFSEIQFIVNHNSQSDGQNKSAQRWTNSCKRRPYISSHSRGTEKIPRTIYLTLNKSGKKWAYQTWIRFSSCCLYQKSSTPRVRRKSLRAYFSITLQEMASLFKHIVVRQV